MANILVVEDEQNIRDNINEILLSHNYNTVLATDGEDALAKVESWIPDLVLSDIKMPLLDGYALFKEFQNMPSLTNIPFVFLTAKVEVEDLRKGLLMGVDDYLTKPFRAQELLDTVNKRLEKNRKIRDEFERIQKNIALYVPHELRTPLVSIMGYADLLSSEFENHSAEDAKEMINHIKSSSIRLNETIEKFLVYSEVVLDQGSNSKDNEYIKFSSSISEPIIIDIISDKVLKYDRSYDINIAAETKELKVSKNHLQYMIIQLIDNAFKFSAKSSTVKIEGNVKNDHYQLTFTDYGIGMTNEQINLIGAFKQHNRSQLQQEGNGLGLATIKEIIELSGGEIQIKSEPDNFTIVDLLLPLN